MQLFIAGICGTFMAGIAQIATAMGHTVTGCDENVYPPMSDVLAAAGITVRPGYDPAHIPEDCDQVIIGNALSRGNPLVEHVLSGRIPYTSGPEWLGRNLLRSRSVVAIAGTHGKTSTASMAAWILESAGVSPGFLIGGKPGNFAQSARVGEGDWFVIEADEYDTAFFDKRSKFVHYYSDVAVLNNLEFDHADIFDNLGQIKRQFHHLVRTVPGAGCIVTNVDDTNLASVLEMGCWSPVSRCSLSDAGSDWFAEALNPAADQFAVFQGGERVGEVDWSCIGHHNMQNALSAIAATHAAGVDPGLACDALAGFRSTARRLERLAVADGTVLYEDFAHHPTAIRTTLESVRHAHPDARIVALIEPRSNTMRMSVHEKAMGEAIELADEAIFYLPTTIDWDPAEVSNRCAVTVVDSPDAALAAIHRGVGTDRVIVAMSNGSFDGIPRKIQEALTATD